MDLPRLEDLGDLSGRRVLVRCDFNVPLTDGQIADDLRIRAALPTLRYLLDAGAIVTACSPSGTMPIPEINRVGGMQIVQPSSVVNWLFKESFPEMNGVRYAFAPS